MNDSDQLEQFYLNLREEVTFETRADEDGCSKEEMFTRIAIRRLEEAGEVENAQECRDVRENRAGKTQHRVNGYALSEGYDTLDLFVTLFKGTEAPARLNAQDLRAAVSQLARFADRAMKGYVEELEESAPVYDLAVTLRKHWKEVVRINLFVLADGLAVAQELPTPPELGKDTVVALHVRDLEYFHRLSVAEGGRIPIEIDFLREYGRSLPCVPFRDPESDYESFLTILPGSVLSDVYQRFGARLLEQNVRAFLQFTGNINRGIRDTIQHDPGMFFAYNNGIAATAESVSLRQYEGGETAITAVRDFQVVNGGQTTASVFHTWRKHKADLGRVAVPVKLTVVKEPERFTEIVSRIARYANSQNKVTEADLSSNNPFNVELERLSRTVWAPARAGDAQQTHWFFERARGQFKNAMERDGYTPARKKAFEKANPRNQKFDKEDISKFTFSWDGSPWLVVRGRQKSYAEFIRQTKSRLPDRQYFEDLIAKAIAFKTAEQLYGTKSQDHAIGDLRYIVVPYALSWLTYSVEREGRKLDLWRIWKAQVLSQALRKEVRRLLVLTDKRVRELSSKYGGLIGEWAKKEEAWVEVMTLDPSVQMSSILEDLETPTRPRPQYGRTETEDLEKQAEDDRIRALPIAVWERLHKWAADRIPRPDGAPDLLWYAKTRLRNGERLTESERRHAIVVLDRALSEARELFSDVDELLADFAAKVESKKRRMEDLTVEDAKALFRWEQQAYKLPPADVYFLKDVRDGKRSLSSRPIAERLLRVMEKAESYGFGFDE